MHWSSYCLDLYVLCSQCHTFYVVSMHVPPPTCIFREMFCIPSPNGTHTCMHTCTHTLHTHIVKLSSTQPSTFFEGYLVEARESTSDGFVTNSSIWGTWSVNRSDPYHTVCCNRNSTSQEGPFPVSTLAASFRYSSCNVVCMYVVYQLDHLFNHHWWEML